METIFYIIIFILVLNTITIYLFYRFIIRPKLNLIEKKNSLMQSFIAGLIYSNTDYYLSWEDDNIKEIRKNINNKVSVKNFFELTRSSIVNDFTIEDNDNWLNSDSHLFYDNFNWFSLIYRDLLEWIRNEFMSDFPYFYFKETTDINVSNYNNYFNEIEKYKNFIRIKEKNRWWILDRNLDDNKVVYLEYIKGNLYTYLSNELPNIKDKYVKNIEKLLIKRYKYLQKISNIEKSIDENNFNKYYKELVIFLMFLKWDDLFSYIWKRDEQYQYTNMIVNIKNGKINKDNINNYLAGLMANIDINIIDKLGKITINRYI